MNFGKSWLGPSLPFGRGNGQPMIGEIIGFETTRLEGGYAAMGVIIFWGSPFILRGDLDWFLKRMKLQNYGSAFPCNLCKCNLSDVPWNDLRRLALSLTTTWDDATWKAAHANCKCLLYRLDFFSFLTTSVDWLHTMHIGILQYVYASILTLLVYHELPGSPNDNIKTVMQFLRQYWKRNPTPAHFRYIRLSMFSVDPDEGYPKLKGRASEIKHLSKGLCACWDHYRVQDREDPKNVPHMQMLLLLKKNY